MLNSDWLTSNMNTCSLAVHLPLIFPGNINTELWLADVHAAYTPMLENDSWNAWLLFHGRNIVHKCNFILCLPLDWIEQCFTSPPTQYRLYGRRFLQVKRPNQQYQSTEGTYITQITQKYTIIRHNKHKTANDPLVYNNMEWLGDGSHRGQGCQAWMSVPTIVVTATINRLKWHFDTDIKKQIGLWTANIVQ